MTLLALPRGRRGVAAAIVLLLAAGAAAVGGDEERPVKEFRVDVENWKWVPDRLHVTKGDKVVLHIKSYDATHRFDLKAWGLKVTLPQDKTTTVEFVADKAGKFTWRCGRPCGNGCPKMTGKLFVTEPAAAGGKTG